MTCPLVSGFGFVAWSDSSRCDVPYIPCNVHRLDMANLIFQTVIQYTRMVVVFHAVSPSVVILAAKLLANLPTLLIIHCERA